MLNKQWSGYGSYRLRPTPKTIWQAPAYLPYVQPELTEDLIAEAERRIGYQLPGEYLNLLRTQNGGYIRYETPESVGDIIAGIGPFFPSITDFGWEEVREHVSYPLDGLVPFDGDGHWYNCLDYRENTMVPAVAYIDIECDSQEIVADSFVAYLDSLRLNVENELVIANARDIDQTKQELSRVLEVAFEDRISSNGVPYFLGSPIPGRETCVSISPNTVPRGFVREDDSRYNELRDLQEGNALVFPELPSDTLLLRTFDEMYDQVVETCQKAGIELVPVLDYMDGI